MQAHWFGGLVGKDRSFTFPAPDWFRTLRMTATATIYTPFGFAIAADGRERWEHELTRDIAAREAERNSVQKIFAVESQQLALAYAIRGHTANRDRSFDVAVELRNQLTLLHGEEFANCRQFLEHLSAGLEHALEVAKVEQRIEEYPATEMPFVGYFNGDPCWFDIQFHPFRNPRTGALWELTSRDLYPDLAFVTGSLVVGKHISHSDPRFAQFWKPLNREGMSLQDAVDFARGYIEACCSRVALEVDPSCEELGGHIHVATVTPEEGFQWVIPAISPG